MTRSSPTPAFQELPPVGVNDGSRGKTPSFYERRTIGPGGFGKQFPQDDSRSSRTPTPTLQHSLPQLADTKQAAQVKHLECFLPFKLFQSRGPSPSMFCEDESLQPGAKQQDGPRHIQQMEHFISETAQTMVAPHCLSCAPHQEGRGKEDLFKMETLGDLMKKHKDAFQEEYAEFGPASVWAPDAPNSNSLPIPVAARRLGKFFDLRGELSTINHVKRARCRQRPPPPVLLHRMPTPMQHTRSATTLGHYDMRAHENASKTALSKKKIQTEAWVAPPSICDRFPSSLQALYLPAPRADVGIAEDARVDVNPEAGTQ